MAENNALETGAVSVGRHGTRDSRILNQVQDDVSGFSDPVNRAQTARSDPKAPQNDLPLRYFQASARPWVKVK